MRYIRVVGVSVTGFEKVRSGSAARRKCCLFLCGRANRWREYFDLHLFILCVCMWSILRTFGR